MAEIADQACAIGVTKDQLNDALEAISIALPPLTALLNAAAPPEGRLAEMAAEMIMERMMSAQAATEQLRDQAADAAETAERLVEEHRNDPLTGQLTRRSFEVALDEHVEQWNRFGWPLAVLFIDVDHFKQVNDTYGHGVGDEVLTHVAATLARQLRQGDLIGRFGGDEFVIALPAVNVTTVRSVAARLVAAVRSHPVTTPTGELHHQTISVGVATTDRHPAADHPPDAAGVGRRRPVRRQAPRPQPVGRGMIRRTLWCGSVGCSRSRCCHARCGSEEPFEHQPHTSRRRRRAHHAVHALVLPRTSDRACVGASNPMTFIAQARKASDPTQPLEVRSGHSGAASKASHRSASPRQLRRDRCARRVLERTGRAPQVPLRGTCKGV